MFKKRVGFVRDLERDISILKKKQVREISKLNSDIEKEINKKLKKIHPAARVDIFKLDFNDFKTNPKRREPLRVQIECLCGKFMSHNNKWVEYCDDFSSKLQETDNRFSVEEMLKICSELSEELGILVEFSRFS